MSNELFVKLIKDSVNAERNKEFKNSNQATLGELINFLSQKKDQNEVLKEAFNEPHSYRGYYDELAFEPCEDISVGELLKIAKDCIGKTFTGYKGGEYTMTRHAPIWLSQYGTTGEEITLDYLESLK